MEKIEFIKNRLQIMKEKNESLEPLAVASKVSRRTLTNIINGNSVTTKTIDKIYDSMKGKNK